MTTTRYKIDAPILCVAPWAGGKRTLAPRIVELLGEHETYVEPFCGGCSILPQKLRSSHERINDLSRSLVNVLQCVQRHADAVGGLLSGWDFSREAFERSLRFLADHPQPPVSLCGPSEVRLYGHAAHQLVVWWMGPNGLAGTTGKPWFATRHTKTGGSPATRWNSFRRSLPALSERLRDVWIHWEHWREFLDPRRIGDSRSTVIYVDPPYFAKSFRYVHDFTDRDHINLAERLNQFRRARIVVSYYDQVEEDGLFGGGSRLDELYPPGRWERHEVRVSKGSANARTGAARTEAVEVLLVNRT